MTFPETIFRWTHRLFGIGLLLIVLGVIETNFGVFDTPFLRTAVAVYLLVAMIAIPAAVLCSYFVVVCGLALYALRVVSRHRRRA